MTTRINRKRCGIDIGGTQIKAVIMDDSNQIIEELSAPSNANKGPEFVKEAISRLIHQISNQGHKLNFLGIGCAGSVDSKQGIIRNSPNFAHWKDVDLKNWAEKLFQIPVQVDNDANCATLAEWKLGRGRGVRNFILLTLGTGIGGGLILQNQLYRGSTGTGGELGHFSINSHGAPCPCGNQGCFERYCSASALSARNSKLSCEEIFSKVGSDTECRQMVQEFLHHLKVGLTSLANIFDPDLILLGGAVSRGLPPYIEDVRASVQKSAFPAVGKNIKIDFTQFQNNSGAIGAALLETENLD